MYEYECDACGHRFETLQRMSDDPLKECPACDAPALRKLISAASFKLKGQGWYESDFKNPQKAQSKKDGQAEKSDSSSTEKSTDSGTGGQTDSGAGQSKSQSSDGSNKSSSGKGETSK
jgi:putative FmdB family regulatory protein